MGSFKEKLMAYREAEKQREQSEIEKAKQESEKRKQQQEAAQEQQRKIEEFPQTPIAQEMLKIAENSGVFEIFQELWENQNRRYQDRSASWFLSLYETKKVPGTHKRITSHSFLPKGIGSYSDIFPLRVEHKVTPTRVEFKFDLITSQEDKPRPGSIWDKMGRNYFVASRGLTIVVFVDFYTSSQTGQMKISRYILPEIYEDSGNISDVSGNICTFNTIEALFDYAVKHHGINMNPKFTPMNDLTVSGY